VHLLVGDAAAATLVNTAGNRAFLTRDCEGHRAGFGRDEESAAEIYHSFYALAGLAIMQGEDGRDACGDVVTPDAQSGANAGAEARVGAGTEDKDEEAETCELHREEHWRLRPIDPLLGITRRAACTEGVVYEPLCAVFRAPA
jgi:prenyltransferase beta subunit